MFIEIHRHDPNNNIVCELLNTDHIKRIIHANDRPGTSIILKSSNHNPYFDWIESTDDYDYFKKILASTEDKRLVE